MEINMCAEWLGIEKNIIYMQYVNVYIISVGYEYTSDLKVGGKK